MAKSNFKEERTIREQQARKRDRIHFAIEIVAVILLSAICSWMFFGSYAMQEASMNPSIETGDRILVNRMAYSLSGVRRGDVIAYKSKDSADSSIHIKRVIGLPGETIQIKDGMILINGKTYMEGDDLPAITNPGTAKDEITIGEKTYFVLGDNRNGSEDSRFADVGNIHKDNIVGKAWFIASPADNRGFIR